MAPQTQLLQQQQGLVRRSMGRRLRQTRRMQQQGLEQQWMAARLLLLWRLLGWLLPTSSSSSDWTAQGRGNVVLRVILD